MVAYCLEPTELSGRQKGPEKDSIEISWGLSRYGMNGCFSRKTSENVAVSGKSGISVTLRVAHP